jgi:hypothetical protein
MDEVHHKKGKKAANEGAAGLIYSLGVIGALIYFISSAVSFWDGFIGIFQALLWPAFLVYELLKHLGA